MQHFIAYRNSDQFGSFGRRRNNQEYAFFTAKRYRKGTLVGHRLWVFEGGGSPKHYHFVASGIISRLADAKRPAPWSGMGKNVHYRADTVQQTEVTNKPWFKKLLKEQVNFSRGLQKTSGQSIITALKGLRNNELGDRARRDDIADVANLNSLKLPKLVLRAIRERQGQPKFRRAVLNAYERKCAISGCDLEQAVEAAHIRPYSGGRSDRLSNALLLRADLHTLFDLGLVSIDAQKWTVVMDANLRRQAEYGDYHGKKIHLPRDKKYWPSKSKLDQHRRAFGL
jgi:hypothetical protein